MLHRKNRMCNPGKVDLGTWGMRRWDSKLNEVWGHSREEQKSL